MSADGPRVLVTFFPDEYAKSKHEQMFTLAELARRIRASTASRKERLWWLKLARFGDEATDKGCLRNDNNVIELTGIEIDYDGEAISVDEAVATLRRAGLLAIIYTSPSHKEEAPRWRVLCPAAKPHHPDWHETWVARVNGVFGGALTRDDECSFKLSQSYYFGSVRSQPECRVEIIQGAPIDERADLDAGAVGKAKPATAGLVGTAARCDVLTDYGEAALRSAADKILGAPDGCQERTLNAECLSIGRLAGVGGVPVELALDILLTAALAMASYDPARPWRHVEVERRVRRSFAQGLAQPRADRADIEREADRLNAEASEAWEDGDA